VTGGWLPQKAGLPGLNGGGAAAAVRRLGYRNTNGITPSKTIFYGYLVTPVLTYKKNVL